MQIIKGIGKNRSKTKVIPERKSTQLTKSLNNPKRDLIIRIIPKKIKRKEGNFILVPNIKINPAIRSIPPKILTSMFFKSRLYLKRYPSLAIGACNSVWIECHPPKVEVEGSNPSRRVVY